MLGIEDGWVLAGYLLCIAGAILCAVYGVVSWVRGDGAASEAAPPRDGQTGELIQ